MTGAYTAKPEDVVDPPDRPVNWNPLWPYPGPEPPGYYPEYDIKFVVPPTPAYFDTIEEITARVKLFEVGAGSPPGELATVAPTESLDWEAYISDSEIPFDTTTKGWTNIAGFWYSTWTLTPSIVLADYIDPSKDLEFSVVGEFSGDVISDDEVIPIKIHRGMTVDSTVVITVDKGAPVIWLWTFGYRWSATDPVNGFQEGWETWSDSSISGPDYNTSGSPPSWLAITATDRSVSVTFAEDSPNACSFNVQLDVAVMSLASNPDITGLMSAELTNAVSGPVASLSGGGGEPKEESGPASISSSFDIGTQSPEYDIEVLGGTSDGIFDDMA